MGWRFGSAGELLPVRRWALAAAVVARLVQPPVGERSAGHGLADRLSAGVARVLARRCFGCRRVTRCGSALWFVFVGRGRLILAVFVQAASALSVRLAVIAGSLPPPQKKKVA